MGKRRKQRGGFLPFAGLGLLKQMGLGKKKRKQKGGQIFRTKKRLYKRWQKQRGGKTLWIDPLKGLY